MTLVIQEQQPRILKSFYAKRNTSLYNRIRINSTTWILEMLPCKRARILKHLNTRLDDKKYGKKTPIEKQVRTCPMRYTKVLCHTCFEEIYNKDLYLSKQNQSKTKFYHIHCAAAKNII